MSKQARPTGVAIVVGLEILAGIITLVFSFYLLTLPYFPGNSVIYFTGFGLVSLMLAYGLWNGRRWAWILALILSAIGILFWFANLLDIITVSPSTDWGSIINIAIYLVIILYLTRPQVRSFFMGH